MTFVNGTWLSKCIPAWLNDIYTFTTPYFQCHVLALNTIHVLFHISSQTFFFFKCAYYIMWSIIFCVIYAKTMRPIWLDSENFELCHWVRSSKFYLLLRCISIFPLFFFQIHFVFQLFKVETVITTSLNWYSIPQSFVLNSIWNIIKHLFKVILYSNLILKKMNERITDS